jgi:hypothetical protein
VQQAAQAPPPSPPVHTMTAPSAAKRASMLASRAAGAQAAMCVVVCSYVSRLHHGGALTRTSRDARSEAEQLRLLRIQQSAASIAAATPASAVLGGSRPALPHNEAAARAATRRANHEVKQRLDKEAEARAAKAVAEAGARAVAHAAQTQAREANAARAAAEAAAAARGSRAAWANGSAELHAALSVLRSHADTPPQELAQSVAQLLAILTTIRDRPDDDRCRRLNVHAARFPRAHGALALLAAVGFDYDDGCQRLVLPADGYSRAALAATVGELETLQRQLTR